MKHLHKFEEHNEGLKTTLLGAGLAASLLGTPGASRAHTDPQIEIGAERDGVAVSKKLDTLFNSRKERIKDQKLLQILDEIKININSEDSAKYLELFDKLSGHLQKEYGWKFERREIEELNEAGLAKLENNKTKVGLFAILGWLGSICLAICGVPQAWMSFKEKHSRGISWAFLLLWSFGEIFALAYVYDKLDLPLLLNYSVNILILAVILFFKINPSSPDDGTEQRKFGH